MPKARKRKAPVTTSSAPITSSSKPQSSRTVIRQFHVLLKEQAKLNASGGNDKALADIQRRIDELGGIECYQSMSAIGQGTDRGGGSEKVFIAWLKELGMHKARTEKLKLLEVGYGSQRVDRAQHLLQTRALLPDNYASCASWIDATPMDLHSRHAAILEQDFLTMDQEKHREKWDLISLSLVVNFVPVPEDRGRMLRLAHSMLVPDGKLFLALPLPCVNNSRYMDFNHLRALLQAIGFQEIKQRWKPTGKMAYWMYERAGSIGSTEAFLKKRVLKDGNRNNFCILL
ncbi:nucleolus protein [Mucidula mucida]|nr:nucleolus protein [Mucidula mucida]